MTAPLDPSAVETVQIGRHTVEITGDCTLVRLRGPFVLDEMKQWCRIADQVIARHGHLFTISDFSGGGVFSAESRSYAGHWPNVVHIHGTASFGATLATSVVVEMTARVTAQVQKYAVPTMVATTEGEARAWVDSQRQKRKPAAGDL